MPARKIRVELFDSDGNKYTVAFEGQITRDKAVRLLDLVELLGGMPNNTDNPESNRDTVGIRLSKYDKVRMIVKRNLPFVWFSSREVQTAYEREFKEPLGISTVATYLSRLAETGALTKTGPSNNLKYKLSSELQKVKLYGQ